MSLKEYWDGDPDNLKYVREAYLLRRRQANTDAWMQGLYVYHAMQCVSPLFRDWVRDHHPEKYLEEPFDLYPSKEKLEEARQEDQRELANQATIRAWVERANRLYEKKHQKEDMVNG